MEPLGFNLTLSDEMKLRIKNKTHEMSFTDIEFMVLLKDELLLLKNNIDNKLLSIKDNEPHEKKEKFFCYENDRLYELLYENFTIYELYLICKFNIISVNNIKIKNIYIFDIFEDKIKNLVKDINSTDLYDKYPISFWIYYGNDDVNFHITLLKNKRQINYDNQFTFWYTNKNSNHCSKNQFDKSSYMNLIHFIIFNNEYTLTQFNNNIEGCLTHDELKQYKAFIDQYKVNINHNNRIITISENDKNIKQKQVFEIKNVEEIVENLFVIIHFLEFNNV